MQHTKQVYEFPTHWYGQCLGIYGLRLEHWMWVCEFRVVVLGLGIWTWTYSPHGWLWGWGIGICSGCVGDALIVEFLIMLVICTGCCTGPPSSSCLYGWASFVQVVLWYHFRSCMDKHTLFMFLIKHWNCNPNIAFSCAAHLHEDMHCENCHYRDQWYHLTCLTLYVVSS